MSNYPRECEISAAIRATAGKLVDLADANRNAWISVPVTSDECQNMADLLLQVAKVIDPLIERFAFLADLTGDDAKMAENVMTLTLEGDLEYVIRNAGEPDDDAYDPVREHGTYRAGAL